MITRIRVEGEGSLVDLQDEFERVTLALISAFGSALVQEEVFERQRGSESRPFKGRRVILAPIRDESQAGQKKTETVKA